MQISERRTKSQFTSKETRKSVAKAKSISVHHLYEELNTKEGEAKIYKIAKTRQRKRMDKQAVNMIKDNNGKILTDEEAIKDRWNSYFDELLNKENARETLEDENTTEGPEHVGHGGALVESIAFNRRVVGSTPALAAM